MAKYIWRRDDNGRWTHGWSVAYPKNTSNITDIRTKFFSDKKYGGKRKSHLAAKKFRDKKYAELELSYLITRKTRSRQRSPTKDGIIGVKYYDYLSITPYWQAHGSENDQQWSKQFSVYKYGSKGAFLMACKERYKRHGTLFIHDRIKDLPCRPDVPYKLIKSK